MQIKLITSNDYIKKCGFRIKNFLIDITNVDPTLESYDSVFEKYKDSKEKFIKQFILISKLYKINYISYVDTGLTNSLFSVVYDNDQYSGIYAILISDDIFDYNIPISYFSSLINDRGEDIKTSMDLYILNSKNIDFNNLFIKKHNNNAYNSIYTPSFLNKTKLKNKEDKFIDPEITFNVVNINNFFKEREN